MSLIHHAAQIGPDVVALSCPRCRTRYSVDEIGDDLRCLDCGAGGMIAHKASRMTERFPEPLASRYTPIPEALMDHAATLGIGPHELVLIWALERHRRLMGDEVRPGRTTLARLSRLSEHQVKRASSNLVALGLLTRRQPGNARGIGRAANRYGLDPLWQRLAELEGTSAPQTRLEVHTRPQTPSADGLRADSDPFAGADGTVWGAPVRHEVDVVEVDAVEEDPVGTSPAAPDLAADDDPDAERYQAFMQTWHAEYPRLKVNDAWARFTAENDSIERAA